MNRVIKFRACPILPEFYEVSNTGHVMNMRGKFLKEWKDRDGYPHVYLVQGGKRYYRAVHKLVATAFHGLKPTEKHQVNHKNGVRDDNRPENLEWVTSRENTLHGWASGRQVSEKQRTNAKRVFGGANNPKAKITKKDAEFIRWLREKGMEYKKIAPHFSISVAQVGAICTNRNWV